MKSVIMMMILFSSTAFGGTTSFDLIGRWRIDGYLYLTDRYPREVNELSFDYVFNYDHTATISIARESTGEHCEVRLAWELVDGELVETPTWENPENSFACDKDPELVHVGQSANVAFRPVGEDIALKPNDNSLPVFYIFKRSGRPGDLTHD